METRYSNMIVVLAVTFFYSGGMPILYASACLFFFVTYWVDKFLLLRCYRKPIKFNNHLALASMSFYKYICILHLLGFLIMFGLTPILPTRMKIGDGQTDPSALQFKTNYGDFTLYSIYLWIVIVIIAVLILVNLPFKAIGGCIDNCSKKKLIAAEDEINFSDDFFKCASYAALK